MGEFLSYSIVSGLLLLALFLGYKVLLARENQPQFNRGVLLSIYAVAFLLLPSVSVVNRLLRAAPVSVPLTVDTEIEGNPLPLSEHPVWSSILIWIFIGGMLLVTVRTLIVWSRLVNLIRNGERVELGRTTFILTDHEGLAPFSWVKYIVIDREDFAARLPLIAAHEMKHIACRHWIDLLLAQMVCIVNWFNPAAWLMRDELMLVHEYQADMAVIESGHDARAYQMLLIKKAVGARFPSLANSLNHSKLKKRITMMYQKRSGAGRKVKALALVPVLALALGVAGIPAVKAAVSTISSTSMTTVGQTDEKSSEQSEGASSYKVVSISDNGLETSIVVKGENLGSQLTVSGGVITSGGETYKARQMGCNMTDGAAIITALFPYSGELNGAILTLTLNGKEVPFALEGSNVSKTSGASTPSVRGMKIFVDDVEITFDQLAAVNSEAIESIEVDKKANKIKVSLKK